MKQQTTYAGFEITITDNCITVRESYMLVERRMIKHILQHIATLYPNNVTKNRSICSLCNEWIAHSRLYRLGIAKSHTRDVDLEYPQSALHSIAWAILGTI